MSPADYLVKEITDSVWLRFALVLTPIREHVIGSRPALARLMTSIITSVEGDIAAHVSRYEVRRLRDETGASQDDWPPPRRPSCG